MSARAMAVQEVLADEAVGVLVGAALPGVVRGGKVEAGAEGRLEGSVAVGLGAVVDGDRADRVGLGLEERDDPVVDGGGRAVREPTEEALAGLPLDETEGAGAGAGVDAGRAGGDGALARGPAATIPETVALPIALRGASHRGGSCPDPDPDPDPDPE
ncbi:MAG: hypothetical protein ABJB33_03890 [Gemmatimonadota bacterium]